MATAVDATPVPAAHHDGSASHDAAGDNITTLSPRGSADTGAVIVSAAHPTTVDLNAAPTSAAATDNHTPGAHVAEVGVSDEHVGDVVHDVIS